MEATPTIRLTNHRTAAAALLAAGIFAAGAALGAVAGTTLLPETVQVIAGSATSEHDAAGLLLQRQGEINAADPSASDSGLLLQRQGEINAGGAPANRSVPAVSRYEVNRGKR